MKLNEDALNRLLHSPDGPVGRLLQEHAEALVQAAIGEAGVIIERVPAKADVVAGIDSQRQEDGSVLVGIRGEQQAVNGKPSVSWYLAKKEANMAEKGWLRPAARAVFPG